MKKNYFLKSTLILLIGGCLTKILGLVIKIIYTRILGDSGISLFALITPTYSLLLTLANFNIQTAITKQISAKHNTKKVLIHSFYIMSLLNILLLFGFFFCARFISSSLLQNEDTYYPLLAASLSLPFVSIGYVVKGYFYGKQNIAPHMISNVLEQLFRLLLISYLLPKVTIYGTITTVCVLLLFNILTESFSIVILYLFLPKKFSISKQDFSFDKEETKGLLHISIPSISGRLLGNIGYFFEPILLTTLLLWKGFDYQFILNEYGHYNAYTIPTLLFPSFFITAISNALLPEISKFHEQKNKSQIKKRLKESLLLSFGVGFLCTLFIFLFKEQVLQLLYHTQNGLEYIKILTPFFLLFYLEAPLSSILIGMDKIKACTFISISGILLKLSTMCLFCILGFGMYSLVFCEIINILYVTLFDFYILKKSLVRYNI